MVCGLGSAFLSISILGSRGLKVGDVCWPGACHRHTREELRAWLVECPRCPLAQHLCWLPERVRGACPETLRRA